MRQSFSIVSTNGQLRTSAPLDYETEALAFVDSELSPMVRVAQIAFLLRSISETSTRHPCSAKEIAQLALSQRIRGPV